MLVPNPFNLAFTDARISAGLNRKYRQVCEMMFRRGYLRVVVATGTLALGINMVTLSSAFRK